MKEKNQSTRTPAVAGSFYSADAELLREQVESLLDEAKDESIQGKLKALIIPHAGLMYSGIVAAVAFKLLKKQVKEKRINIKRIVIVGPAHTLAFNGSALDDNSYWLTPLGKIAIERLNLKKSAFRTLQYLSEAHLHEHSIEVQLPFIQVLFKDKVKILPIVAGFVEEEMLAFDLEKLLDEKTLLIISSDLSHYYDYNTAIRIDSGTNKCIVSLNPIALKESGEACGSIGIGALLYLARKLNWKVKLLEYKNSGDTSGSMSQVVGYSAFAFYETWEHAFSGGCLYGL